MAALRSMPHRMVSMLLSSERYDVEKNRIIDIGRINGYPSSTVNNIVKRHELKKQRLESSVLFAKTKDDTKRIVIPYLQHTSNELSRKFGFQAVNKNVYSLQNLIGFLFEV